MKKRVFAIPFVVMLFGYFLLILVNLIPTDWIVENVRESAAILSEQGNYPPAFLPFSLLDNYTDADCLSIVYNKASDNVFYNSINAFQLARENDTNIGGVTVLSDTIDGKGIKVEDHSYLWHGFQIWLRLLLVVFNITRIRWILFVATVFTSTFVCILLVKIKDSIWAFVPFILSFTLFGCFQIESISLLYFVDCFVMLLGCIAVLCFLQKENDHAEEVFSLIGATVAFTSMIIIPVLTLGFPLIIYISGRKNDSGREKCIKMFKCCFSWGFSYAITVITKILISLIAVNSNRGLDRLSVYTGGGKETIGLLGRIKRIAEVFMRLDYISVFTGIAVILALIIYIAFKHKRSFDYIKSAAPMLAIALLPCMWCFAASSHSLHQWTPWLYGISMFAIIQMLWDLCEFK